MRAFLKAKLEQFIEWMDLPPSPSKPGVAEVNWEFVGDLLGELATLTTQETQFFLQKDFQSTTEIDALIKTWVLPTFDRLTPTSQLKALHSLAYYLNQKPEQLSAILACFAIPLHINAQTLFTRIHSILPKPWQIAEAAPVHSYHENTRRAFVNTLFAYLPNCTTQPANVSPLPVRHGFFLPNELNAHDAHIDLRLLQRQATTGEKPNGDVGIICDASRWLPHIQVEDVMQTAAIRLAGQANANFGISRLTIMYRQPVGEGFLAGHPETCLPARKVHVILDRLGFIVRCYPILR